MLRKIKFNLFIVILCFSIGTITAFPHLFGIFKVGLNYSPLKTTSRLQYMRDETYLYIAQARQILAGHLRGDAYVWEYKVNPSPYVSELFSILPLTLLIALVGPQSALVISDMIFPPILFLLIYLYLRKFKTDYLLSILAALCVLFIPNFSSLFPYISKGGLMLTGAVKDPLFITRTPHPEISLIFLFLSIFAAVRLLSTKVSQKAIIFWTIATSITVYTSLFIGSTVFFGNILLFKQFIKRLNKKYLLGGIFIILLLSLPWIINSIQFQNFIKNSDYFLRISYEKNILFPRQIRYILIALIFFYLRKDYFSKVILSFILSASLISDLHQVILNRNIDADHWITRVIAPIATLILVLIIGHLLRKFTEKKTYKTILLATIIFLIGFSALWQFQWTKRNQEDLLSTDDLQIYKMIEESTPKDSVIGSLSPEINLYLTGISGRRVYIAPADRSLASTQEQIQRVCDLTKLSQNLNDEELSKILEYSIGYKDWLNSDQENLLSNTKKCHKNNSFINYKLDFILDKNITGKYELIRN